MELGERIKHLRQKKGLRQSDIAQIIGIDRVSYLSWEKRSKGLTISQLEQIAIALGVTIRELLFDEKSTGDEREIEYLKWENQLLKKKWS